MGVTPVNTVLQGDSIQRLQEIAPGSVDLVFADPPFNIGYEYDVYNDRRSRKEYLDWSRQWISGVSQALKPSGTFWLAIGDEYAAHLKLIAEDDVGFTCRSWVIWYYTFGVNCARGFSRSHTHLFHLVKDPENFTFNSNNPEIRVPSARQLVYADARANPGGRLPDNTWIYRPQDAPASGFAPMHDTWYFARVAGTFKEREGFHGCQMPEQLLGRIIRVSSCPDELVLDPFSGSGTTLAVAKKLGRRWLGIELSREYVKKINERLDAIQIGDPLVGPADPVRSAPNTAKGKRKMRLRNGLPLPQADSATLQGIVEAYRDTCHNHSTDQLLCDPELNAAFVHACKKQSLPGEPFVWNRLLLRIRKSGQLPKTSQAVQRLTFEMMDDYSYASEIAMQMLSLDYGLRFDDILCRPTAAAEFDRLAARFAPGHTPFHYRWAGLAIRKRATKSRELARDRFAEWLKKKLPAAVPLAAGIEQKLQQPGVYVLEEMGQPLYVGATFNLDARLRNLLKNPYWSGIAELTVRMVPHDGQSLHGLQSILIYRLNPILNCRILRPNLEEDSAEDSAEDSLPDLVHAGGGSAGPRRGKKS